MTVHELCMKLGDSRTSAQVKVVVGGKAYDIDDIRYVVDPAQPCPTCNHQEYGSEYIQLVLK